MISLKRTVLEIFEEKYKIIIWNLTLAASCIFTVQTNILDISTNYIDTNRIT